MALKIKLMRMGTKQKPHHKIVIAQQSKDRDADFVEEIGFYNPTFESPLIKIKRERLDYWLKMGAKPTKTVQALLKKEGQMKTQLTER